MFERFTAEARGVVIGAQEQARRLKHHHVGTEHLLLALAAAEAGKSAGILHEAGLDSDRLTADLKRLLAAGNLGEADAEALSAIGIDLDAVKAKLEETFGPGALDATDRPRKGRFGAKLGHLPFTARAKKVLELSLREAINLRSREIRAEHILLGLLREGNGLAAKLITDAGVSLADLRARTVATLRNTAGKGH